MNDIFQSVFNAVSNGVSVLKSIRDSEGQITDFEYVMANPLAVRLNAGIDLPGKRYCEVHKGVRRIGLFDLLKRVADTGESEGMEAHYTDEGFSNWYGVRAVKLNDGVVYSFEDITERKAAESELKAKNELLEGILNAPNVGMMICKAVRDDSGSIIDFEHLVGSKRSEALANRADLSGQRLFDLFPGAKGQLKDLTEVVETGITNSYEYHYQHGGVDCWFLISNSKYGDGIVHVWEDITVQKKSEEQARQNQILAELNRAKTDFLSNVSHEFRTPLTLMLGPIEDVLTKLDKNGLSGQDLSMMKMVHRNALRLQKLVNSLLDFSRIEAGRMDAVFQPTDLGEYTTLLAGSFRSAIQKAGLKFTVRCASPEPVYVNRDMWEKIVLNLLSNAFKFTFDGRIDVLLTDHKKHVQLQVCDTGIGIASENISRIFERFVRIESRSRTYEGSGIGLSLVNELVKMHVGNIKVKSKIGKGTVFRVNIPKGKAHLPPKSIHEVTAKEPLTRLSTVYAEEAMSWLDVEGTTQPSGLNPGVKEKPVVLLADDNYDMREYVRSILSDNYTVIAVNNGKKVFDMLSDGFIPDLILADVMMPEVDGNTLVKRVKANPLTSAIPTMLLSAKASEESKIEGIINGADDYIVKPFSRSELRVRVDARLRLAAIQKQQERKLTAVNTGLQQKAIEGAKELDATRRVIESQKVFLHRVLNSIPQMLWIFDSNGKVNFVNESWCNYTGMCEEQLIHYRIHEYDVLKCNS